MNFLKNYPIPISGLILSMFAIGNLLEDYSPSLRIMIGILASLLYIVFVVKLLFLNIKLKNEFKNPVIASVFLTFAMSTMLFSTYINEINFNIALIIWYFGVILHFVLVLWFSYKFLLNFNIKNVFPSWFIVYVGWAVTSVSAPEFNRLYLGKIAFWFSFIGYITLVSVVCYRVFVIRQIEDGAKPTFIVFSAPASLLLAGYLSSFEVKQTYILIFLSVFSLFFYTLAIIGLSRLLKLKFSPGYSAFTFPLVISATSMKKLSEYLNGEIGLINLIAKIQIVVAILIVFYVLVRYLIYLSNLQTK